MGVIAECKGKSRNQFRCALCCSIRSVCLFFVLSFQAYLFSQMGICHFPSCLLFFFPHSHGSSSSSHNFLCCSRRLHRHSPRICTALPQSRGPRASMKRGTARLRSGASTVKEAPHTALADAEAKELQLLSHSAAPHRVSKNATTTSDDETVTISSASRSFTGSSQGNPPQLASTSSEQAIQAAISSVAIASEHANANAPEAGNCSRKKKKKTKRRRTTPTPVGWPPSPGIHLDERSVKRLANEEVIKQEQAQAIKTKEQPDDERTYSSDRDSDEANLRNFLQQLPVDFT